MLVLLYFRLYSQQCTTRPHNHSSLSAGFSTNSTHFCTVIRTSRVTTLMLSLPSGYCTAGLPAGFTADSCNRLLPSIIDEFHEPIWNRQHYILWHKPFADLPSGKTLHEINCAKLVASGPSDVRSLYAVCTQSVRSLYAACTQSVRKNTAVGQRKSNADLFRNFTRLYSFGPLRYLTEVPKILLPGMVAAWLDNEEAPYLRWKMDRWRHGNTLYKDIRHCHVTNTLEFVRLMVRC